MILLAVITAAYGIQGAVKVKTFTQSPKNILAYGPLQDERGRLYPLRLVREVSPDSLIASIEGVKDRSQAELLRGTQLYIERTQLPDLSGEEFYHSDLMGLPVQDLEGREVGRVRAVNNFGAGDFLEIIDSDHHLYTIPFTREAVPVIRLSMSREERFIKINSGFLLDATIHKKEGLQGEDIQGER